MSSGAESVSHLKPNMGQGPVLTPEFLTKEKIRLHTNKST